MKKYRMLTAGERTIKGDEYNYGHGFEDMSHEEGYIVSAPDEGYIRRPVPYEGKVAFLVTYSPTIRVVIDTTGLTDEQIDAKLAQVAKSEFCYNHAEHMNNFGENIDWEQTKEDAEVPFVEPQPKIPGKYRYLGIGEVIEAGDELFKIDLARFEPIENGFEWLIGAKFSRAMNQIRRPITEPRYRPFKEGDVIEEGDQVYHEGEWFPFNSSVYGEVVNPDFVDGSARKLIK